MSVKCNNLNLLSLFSGCGGMDLGFEGNFNVLKKSVNLTINKNWEVDNIDNNWVHLGKTRFKTVFANDIRPDAKIAWSNYFNDLGDETYHLESVVDLVKKEKNCQESIFPKNIDIVTGGFPCQDFSIAGKRKGFNSLTSHNGKKITDDDEPSIENRGHLYIWMREVISITKPKVFIAENVKGLVSLNDVKTIIERDFSSIDDEGYLVVPAKVLHAANYGVPQSRERVIFIGFRKSALKDKAKDELSRKIISSEYDPYPQITHSQPCQQFSFFNDTDILPYVSLRDAFIGLEEPNISKDLSQKAYSKAKYMGKHCQGQTEVKLDSIGPTIRSEHHGNIEFRRLSIEHGGKNLLELENGYIERRLSIRECARIQTFPDDYEFVFKKNNISLSASSSYKLIGNAVPPLLAYNIAKRLELNWNMYFK